MSDLRKVASAVGAAAGLLAVGAAAGVVTERTVVAQAGRSDPESEEPFGRLRGRPVDIVDAEGLRLHVEIEDCTRDNPENLTMVFCHGYALNQDCWHYQRRDLRALARLVFYDQRSHGRSDRTPKATNTIEQLGADLLRVLTEVVPDGPVILVGHSMGGMTVMALALAHPELFGSRVRGVALLATSPGGLQDVSLGLPQIAAKPLHRLLPVTASVLVRKAEFIELGRSRVNDLSLLFTKYYSFGSSASPSVAEFCHQILGATPIDVISEFLTTLQQHQRHRALDVIDGVPAIIMVGADDRMTPAGHSEAMAVEISDAELTILPDTGHMLILERYAEVNAALRRLAGQVRDALAARPYQPPPAALTANRPAAASSTAAGNPYRAGVGPRGDGGPPATAAPASATAVLPSSTADRP